ncbi:MAG: hypothetical protein ACR2JJ_00895 [Sphingomicrobium sp.]
MLGLASIILAAASAATASANASPALTSASPWWEKVTYTISGADAQQACVYESSLAAARNCDGDEQSSPVRAAINSAGAYTKITIERRFTPVGGPDPLSLQPGDTLLGGQVLALAIDGTGEVRGCRILAASGDVRPAYGCNEARAERFEASARETEQVRQAFMAILVYGHEEYLA